MLGDNDVHVDGRPGTIELAQYRPGRCDDRRARRADRSRDPRDGDDSPPYVMIGLTTVLVAGGCLYLLFRRGSIAYRARQDEDGYRGRRDRDDATDRES